MDASYAPFEYFDKDNTTIIGFDADLSKALAAKMGLTAVDVNAGFDTILAGLSSGKHDLGMSAFSVTPERAQTVDSSSTSPVARGSLSPRATRSI